MKKQIDGQLSLFQFINSDCHDYKGKPDFHGERDEIKRMSIEHDFEETIKLRKCICGGKAEKYFRGFYERFVKCQKCGCETDIFKHQYEAMQAWNKYETHKCCDDSCRGCDIPNCMNRIRPVEIRGICDDAYCPKCDCGIDEYKWMDCKRCPHCGQLISWDTWHRSNDRENEEIFGKDWRKYFGKALHEGDNR